MHTSNVGLALSQTDDIAGLVDRIADGMTEMFRTNLNDSSISATAMSFVTFIVVRRPYLALPISLVILTFFLFVFPHCGQYRAAPRKSSSLALLFHQLDGLEKTESNIKRPEDVLTN